MSERNNPALYRQMSLPFDSNSQANESLAAFFLKVEEARKECRISDVVCLVEVSIMSDGEETRGSAKLALGSSGNFLPMLAREYGAARQEHEDNIALLVAKSRRPK